MSTNVIFSSIKTSFNKNNNKSEKPKQFFHNKHRLAIHRYDVWFNIFKPHNSVSHSVHYKTIWCTTAIH